MTKTIFLLQKFVPFKMNDESEHFESKFYYPGELSDAELFRKYWKKVNTPHKRRNSHLSQKQTSKQAVKKTTFPDELSDN